MSEGTASTSQKPRLFVVDDEVNMGRILTKIFTMEGFDVTAFDRSPEALEAIVASPPNVVLTDIRRPDMTGEELLSALKEKNISTCVIMMTGHATIESAISCVKLGAFEYITKPFDTANLISLVRKGMAAKPVVKKEPESESSPRPTTRRAATPPEEISNRHRVPVMTRPMIGSAPSFLKAKALIQKVAPTESPVLITGESGTGKEVAARALHDMSPRFRSNFVAINCASIPENLIESELFGHAKGSFTGAHQLKIGLIEMAHEGTLFLDEIGELPMNLQAKLLRVLQEREITRIGETEPVSVDIRILSATNRKLKQCVKEKTFREDLYYRLNVISIELPPLRDRREDIEELARFFLKAKGSRHGKPNLDLTPEAIAWVKRGRYPGNIRELENLIERVVVMCDSPMIDMLDFPPDQSGSDIIISGEGLERLAKSAKSMVMRETDFKEARDIFERQYLEALLIASNFNVSEASKKASMSRRNLYEKIEKLRIDLDQLKAGSEKPK